MKIVEKLPATLFCLVWFGIMCSVTSTQEVYLEVFTGQESTFLSGKKEWIVTISYVYAAYGILLLSGTICYLFFQNWAKHYLNIVVACFSILAIARYVYPPYVSGYPIVMQNLYFYGFSWTKMLIPIMFSGAALFLINSKYIRALLNKIDVWNNQSV